MRKPAWYLLPLVTLLLMAASVFPAAAQEVRLPPRFTSFTLRDSSRFEQQSLGIRYAYTFDDPAQQAAATAFVYPVAKDRLARPPAEQIADEARDFVASLAGGVRQGWYREYQVAVDTARAWQTADGERPGHMVVAILRSDNEVLVSFMHLLLMGDHYVKTRLTLPAAQWRTSMAPNFGPDLFKTLTLAPASP